MGDHEKWPPCQPADEQEEESKIARGNNSDCSQVNKPQSKAETLLNAASALASLGGSPKNAAHSMGGPKGSSADQLSAEFESAESASISNEGESGAKTPQPLKLPSKRHIPSHKKESCALTFPEKLMSMLDYAEEMKAKSEDPGNFCLTWLPSGNGFLVRDPTTFTDKILPLFFKQAKFSSFTRKLYRWGFHQMERKFCDAKSLPPDAMIFLNKFFKRDARHKMAKMRSITAASRKRKLDSLLKETSLVDCGSNNMESSPSKVSNGECALSPQRSLKKMKVDGSNSLDHIKNQEKTRNYNPSESNSGFNLGPSLFSGNTSQEYVLTDYKTCHMTDPLLMNQSCPLYASSQDNSSLLQNDYLQNLLSQYASFVNNGSSSQISQNQLQAADLAALPTLNSKYSPSSSRQGASNNYPVYQNQTYAPISPTQGNDRYRALINSGLLNTNAFNGNQIKPQSNLGLDTNTALSTMSNNSSSGSFPKSNSPQEANIDLVANLLQQLLQYRQNGLQNSKVGQGIPASAQSSSSETKNRHNFTAPHIISYPPTPLSHQSQNDVGNSPNPSSNWFLTNQGLSQAYTSGRS